MSHKNNGGQNCHTSKSKRVRKRKEKYGMTTIKHKKNLNRRKAHTE